MAIAPQTQTGFPSTGGIAEATVKSWADKLVRVLGIEFSARPPKTEPVSQFLIRSSGGKVYAITVDDAGTLSTALVQG